MHQPGMVSEWQAARVMADRKGGGQGRAASENAAVCRRHDCHNGHDPKGPRPSRRIVQTSSTDEKRYRSILTAAHLTAGEETL